MDRDLEIDLSAENNTETGAQAPIWQRDYFDRYLRSAESYSDKWDYVRNNPVRAKLLKNSDEWPYQGVIRELAH